MSTKLINFRLVPAIGIVKRSVVSQTDFALGNKLKILNDNKQYKKVIELFEQHKTNNTAISSSIIITQALKACTNLGDLQRGSNIHQSLSSNLKDDSYISASLIHLYMQCGELVRAQSLFDKITKRTTPMYGAMMSGYIKNNQPNEAVRLFNEMKNPGEVAINLLFNACAQLGTKEALDLVKKVSNDIPPSFHSNTHILTSLLDALMKCGDVINAETLFNKSSQKVLSMYGAMMKGYIHNKQTEKVFELFNEIKKPNEIILILFFTACAQLGTKEALGLVKKVSNEIPQSFHSKTRLLTSLLDALMKCGDVINAETLFNEASQKVLSMYGAMMKGYIHNNQAEKAINLFKKIKQPSEVNIIIVLNACAQLGTPEALNLTKAVAGKIPQSFYSNSRLLTSLIDALMKCGNVEDAQLLFDKSTNKTISMYGAMLNGFNKENNPFKTLNLFKQLKTDALSGIGDYSLSTSFIERIPDSVFVDNQIQNILIDMWGKTGSVTKAEEVFKKVSKLDQIGYTSMVNTYGLNGMGTEAIKLYYQIPSKLINEATHVCVLNACSHSGLVDQARSIFKNIQNKTEKIYTTMIDCLSRASFFGEAQQLIDEYQSFNSPAPSMYMALLSGARNEKNAYLSQQVFDRMKKYFPQLTDSLTSATILLANVYASSGDIEKASDIRIQLSESGGKKKIGLSWTVVNGKIYQFRAHDRSHPRSDEIYVELEKISKELIEHGHQYDSAWITRPLEEDETVASVLCGHSERLAIAWNFVANPNTSTIQLTKNLRICGDCHRATKLIASIRQCEIIVRDANRIHHFHKNGQCSCNDYF